MSSKLFKDLKHYVSSRPKTRKTVGIFLVVVGFLALVTPLTPGSWLIFVGFELLGIRFLFLEKIRKWRTKN